MNKDLYLIGGGGHCKSCIDVIEQAKVFQIKGIIDLEKNRGTIILSKYRVIGTDTDIDIIAKTNPFFFLNNWAYERLVH